MMQTTRGPSKAYALILCQPGMVKETMRSLRALQREDTYIEVREVQKIQGRNDLCDAYHIVVRLESEDDRLLVQRIASLKDISGVASVQELIVREDVSIPPEPMLAAVS